MNLLSNGFGRINYLVIFIVHFLFMKPAAIRSNRVITEKGVEAATLIIEEGIITDIVKELPGGAFELTDVGDQVLMAGIVDPHVHINEPGRTEWEGFDTATKAALAGGITSLIEMPLNASPVTTTVKAFEEKLLAAKGKMHVHCGFWGGLIPQTMQSETDIEKLIEKGVFGFKAFLTHSGIDEFPNVTEADLRRAMPIIAASGLPLLVHCELSSPLHQSPASTRLYKDYLASRPKKWENEAINLMIRLCDEYNCRTHIVHVSSAEALFQINDAKHRGLPLTAETCPHYLFFNAEEIPDGATAYKCAPPIREKENNDLLWQALKDGVLDFVATDHSPAPPELKETASGDFMKAWGGIASLQFSLPVLWTAAQKHSCSLHQMNKWLCSNPALLPGLRHKGNITKGADADLVVWNPEESFTVKPEMILHRHKLTPYQDKTLQGVVKQTWLKGKKLFDSLNNETANEEGKFLHLNQGEILFAPH